jgi:two-component system response regulator DesR
MGNRHSPPDIDVLVLDRHDVGRIGLAVILKRAEGIGLCLIAADPEQAISLSRARRPDVAVLEVSGLGETVPAVAAALREAAPGIRLVLRSHCSATAPAAFHTVHAAGFIPATAGAEEAVETVLAATEATLEVPPPQGVQLLTEREQAVLRLLASGATNREIAAAIHIGPDMVKKNVGSILRKLGARNRTEASQLAREALLV